MLPCHLAHPPTDTPPQHLCHTRFSVIPFIHFSISVFQFFCFFRFSVFLFFRILRFIFRLFGTILIWDFFFSSSPTASCDTRTYRAVSVFLFFHFSVFPFFRFFSFFRFSVFPLQPPVTQGHIELHGIRFSVFPFFRFSVFSFFRFSVFPFFRFSVFPYLKIHFQAVWNNFDLGFFLLFFPYCLL